MINFSIQELSGVGKHIAIFLARLNIFTVQDLLLHFPLRYLDRTRITPINSIVPGTECVIEGEITASYRPAKGKTKLYCELEDESNGIGLRFFHAPQFLVSQLKPGTRIRCYGEPSMGKLGLELLHPEIKLISPSKPIPPDPFLTPIYPATQGLSQYILRKLTTNALAWLDKQSIAEMLPHDVLNKFSFPSYQAALQYIHRPPAGSNIAALEAFQSAAQQRLIFEELLAQRLSLLQTKFNFQKQTSFALQLKDNLTRQFLNNLPFQLTAAQQRVLQEIEIDLQRAAPMLRLVQGDVGSGKTVVAALTMLRAIENGYQAALMAPTELLAEQHYRVFSRWLTALNLNVVYLSGSLKVKARRAALASIESGAAQIVIGTHALFQEQVQFHKLGLIVVDEQHRFGVHQRAVFREKGQQANAYPHQLVMTATPIPRTLAMSAYADLDVSVIDELPPGRTPIVTSVLSANKRHEVMHKLQEACSAGKQVYWVCPLIDESEAIEAQAATTAAEELRAALPGIAIGLVHGRLSSAEKEAAMQAFQSGETKILVATTVIEVGVDVPNASLMIIENAERLGLSQLHQLRGRVGRGALASHCILFYQYPISNIGKERLAIMRATQDGFKIAQRDLELRGPGEMLGTRQTGEMLFKVADLLRDEYLINDIQVTAQHMLIYQQRDAAELLKRWTRHAEKYATV